MNAIVKRLAAGSALAAAPALIALGVATASQAESGVIVTGPSVTQPVQQQHPVFPHQDFSIVTAGSIAHHHNQHLRGW